MTVFKGFALLALVGLALLLTGCDLDPPPCDPTLGCGAQTDGSNTTPDAFRFIPIPGTDTGFRPPDMEPDDDLEPAPCFEGCNLTSPLAGGGQIIGETVIVTGPGVLATGVSTAPSGRDIRHFAGPVIPVMTLEFP